MSVCQLYEDVYTGVPRRASLYCRKPGPSHHSTHTLIYTHRVSFFFFFVTGSLGVPRGPVLSQYSLCRELGTLNEGIKHSHPLL